MRHFGQKLKAGAPVTREEVEAFRAAVRIGQRLKCKVFDSDNGPGGQRVSPEEVNDTCILRKKFPHIAVTDKGDLQWTLLALWNRKPVKMITEDIRLVTDPDEDIW